MLTCGPGSWGQHWRGVIGVPVVTTWKREGQALEERRWADNRGVQHRFTKKQGEIREDAEDNEMGQ